MLVRGTRALIGKDLRALRPWAVLCVCLALVDVIYQLLSQVDMQPVSETLTLLGGARLVVTWMVAFAIATGLCTREADDGTLGFLDGLPLGRAHAYVVKCAVTVAVVASLPTLGLLTILPLHALSSGSLDAALRLDLLLPRFALNLVAVAHGVLVGAAFGRLRSLTWLAAGIVVSVLTLLPEYLPRAALLNPLDFDAVERGDGGISVDPEWMLAQLAIAACAFGLGLRGFVRAGRPSRSDLSKRPALKAVFSVATAAVLGTTLALWYRNHDTPESQPMDEGTTVFPTPLPAQTETTHYRISYPAVRSEPALALAARADDVFVRVHALLGQAPGERIDVDASGSARNTAGTAYFGRIRLQLGEDQEAVLAHETSHVVSQRLAGAERDWLWRKASVLNEGLASWVQHRYTGAVVPPADNLVLAALQQRREILPDELANPQLLAQRRGEDLEYSVGEALIVEIVKLYGEAALPRLVRAFGNEKLPVDLEGLDLWQVTFQGAGLDLGAVLDGLGRELERQAERHAAELAALPRPRVRLIRTQSGRIGVEALIDDWHVWDGSVRGRSIRLRFKPARESSLREYDIARGTPGEAVLRPEAKIRSAQICVQAGVQLDDGVLYEPWDCLPTRDAVDWPGS